MASEDMDEHTTTSEEERELRIRFCSDDSCMVATTCIYELLGLPCCVAVVWVGGWDGRSTTSNNRLL